MDVGKKIRLGVIGIGNMGSEHCRNLAAGKCPEIELAAVADVREDRMEWARHELPESVKVFPAGRDLIRSGECNAVLIAVPHYLHEQLAVQAMSHGLDVLCEKPISVEAAAGRRRRRRPAEPVSAPAGSADLALRHAGKGTGSMP